MAKAVLSTFDGSVDLVFLVAPAKTVEEHKADYSKLSVLNTRQPFVRYKSSDSTYSFPDLKAITPQNKKDLSSYLNTLREWTKPDSALGVPRLLKFSFGTFVLPRVYLQTVRTEVYDRRPDGTPVGATVSLDLLVAPEMAKPEITDTKPRLTAREQKEQTKAVKEKLTEDKNSPLLKKIGGKAGIPGLSVGKDGGVIWTNPGTGKATEVGTLREVLGKLPPGLGGL